MLLIPTESCPVFLTSPDYLPVNWASLTRDFGFFMLVE